MSRPAYELRSSSLCFLLWLWYDRYSVQGIGSFKYWKNQNCTHIKLVSKILCLLRGASTYLSLMPGDMLLPLHCDRGTDEIKRVMSLGSGLQVSFWCVRSIMIVLCVSCTDAILKMFSVSPFNLPF